jgi:serine/threonine protein kinase
MEFLKGGNLLDKIIANKKFSEDHALKIIYEVMLALNYMHKNNVTHRDLKPDNLMCVSNDPNDLTIKLTDFGFATFFDPKNGLDLILGS